MSTLLELNGQLAESNEIWKYKKQFWSLAGYSCPNWGSVQSCWPADCHCSLKVVSWGNCVQPVKHSLDNFSLQCWCFICLLIKSRKIRQPTFVNRLSCLRSDQWNFLWACMRDLCKARQILLKWNLYDLDFWNTWWLSLGWEAHLLWDISKGQQLLGKYGTLSTFASLALESGVSWVFANTGCPSYFVLPCKKTNLA